MEEEKEEEKEKKKIVYGLDFIETLDYRKLHDALTEVVENNDVTTMLMVLYMCDYINVGTMPSHLWPVLEEKYSYFESSFRQWMLFDFIHSKDDQPAIASSLHRPNLVNNVWMKGGLLHREHDLPAVQNGKRLEYRRYGKLYRENNQPAIIQENGTQEWYDVNERLHRDNDEPAIVSEATGHREWYQHGMLLRVQYPNGQMQYYDPQGLLHRDNDLPAVDHPDVLQMWYRHGQLHRDNDQPAVINHAKKQREWFQNGVLHRDDGKPAMEDDNEGSVAYFVHGKRYNANNLIAENDLYNSRYRANESNPPPPFKEFEGDANAVLFGPGFQETDFSLSNQRKTLSDEPNRVVKPFTKFEFVTFD